NGNVFRAYLDSPTNFPAPNLPDKGVATTVQALSKAIHQGELTGIRDFDLIQSSDIAFRRIFSKESEISLAGRLDYLDSVPNESLEPQNKLGLHPYFYNRIFGKLMPKFKEHDYGFVSASSVKEAYRFKDEMEKRFAKEGVNKTVAL